MGLLLDTRLPPLPAAALNSVGNWIYVGDSDGVKTLLIASNPPAYTGRLGHEDSYDETQPSNAAAVGSIGRVRNFPANAGGISQVGGVTKWVRLITVTALTVGVFPTVKLSHIKSGAFLMGLSSDTRLPPLPAAGLNSVGNWIYVGDMDQGKAALIAQTPPAYTGQLGMEESFDDSQPANAAAVGTVGVLTTFTANGGGVNGLQAVTKWMRLYTAVALTAGAFPTVKVTGVV